MSDIQLSGNDLYRLIQDKDWQAIWTLLDEGKIKPNQEIVVQFIAYQHKVFLLPCAVMDGANEVVKKLLEKGADPSQRYEGDAPLSIAVEKGNREATEMLIAAGANLNAKTRFIEGDGSQTALMIAAENCDRWAVERLLQAGADPNVLSRKKQSAIWFATSTDVSHPGGDRMKIIKQLVSSGCKLVGNELHWRVYRRDKESVQGLLELGCPAGDVFSHTEPHGPKKGDTPLGLAIETDILDTHKPEFPKLQLQMTEMLLSSGANPNTPNGRGFTPLILAVLGYEFASMMKSPNADVPIQMAQLLLKAGADPKLSPPKCEHGSALDIARKKNHVAFLKLFELAD